MISYTILPSNSDLRTTVDHFLKELEVCYESSRLGAHARGDSTSTDVVHNGMMSWNPNSMARKFIEQNLRRTCVLLGTFLASSRKPKTTTSASARKIQEASSYSFMIFIVNPFDEDPSSLAMISTCFWHLFSTYKQAAKSNPATYIPDVQLQIIPISFLARRDSLVVRQAGELQSFVRELYNRCPPTSLTGDPAALPIDTGWSIQLSEALPRKISFELKSEPPANIMFENSQLHVGYARSASGNWITAAYSDNSGRYQCNASYCMSGERSFLDIAKEIWDTCLEIMKARGVNWRVCIAKVGDMDMTELEGKRQYH
jgi:mediator of RNA polymerase II transcription subunit 13, fungi type